MTTMARGLADAGRPLAAAATSVAGDAIRVVVGQQALTTAALDIARLPGPLTWQVRLLEDSRLAPELLRRPDASHDLYLFDRHVLTRDNRLGLGASKANLEALHARGADVVPFATSADFLHGKLVAGTRADGTRVALLRTNTDEDAAWHQANLGVLLLGRRADVATEVTRTTAHGTAAQVREVADRADALDVLVHDATNGADHLRPAIAERYAEAVRTRTPLVIVDKELTHAGSAREIADAWHAGAQVDLTVGRIDAASEQVLGEARVPYRIHAGWIASPEEATHLADLHDAGVEVEVRPVVVGREAMAILRARGVPISDQPFSHLNLFASGDTAIVTSYHHFPEMADFRGSQELGVRLHGAEARDAVKGARSLVGFPATPVA